MEILKFEIGENKAVLTCYIQEVSAAVHASGARPAVLVLAGGGYEFVSPSEREPIALAYASKGFQAFTLEYSVGEKSVFPRPQREAFEALALIRENADRFFVDPNKIAAVGCSAGGHLAASTGVFWNDGDVNAEKDGELCRPDALVLVYPCISAGEFAYARLCAVHGKGTAFPEKMSLEKYVGKQTPPAFLCHTAGDTCVPAMNSLLFAQALAKAGVPYELHIYKEGPHGLGLATKAVSSPFLQAQNAEARRAVGDIAARFSDWFEKSVLFLQSVFEPVRLGLKDGALFVEEER